jgi:hypothetical protein
MNRLEKMKEEVEVAEGAAIVVPWSGAHFLLAKIQVGPVFRSYLEGSTSDISKVGR